MTAANKSIPYIFIYSANLSKQQNNLYYYIPMCDGRAALKASRANITSPVACRVLHTARGWNACCHTQQEARTRVATLPCEAPSLPKIRYSQEPLSFALSSASKQSWSLSSESISSQLENRVKSELLFPRYPCQKI